MIDLHAHILPGVDDGPEDLEAAVELARAAVAGGTTVMATSSHVNTGFALDPSRFVQWRRRTQKALDAASVSLELVPGGELGLSRLPELDDDQLRSIALGGGDTILLEPPFSPAGPALEEAVADLQGRGFRVLLAHPERSPDFAARLDELVGLVRHGALLQVTAASLTGGFGPGARALAIELLRRRAVHVIASDGHGATHRSPDISQHLDEIASALPQVSEQRGFWTHDAPQAVLDGRAVGRPPHVA